MWQFIDVDESAVFIGGEPKKTFVRIVIEQIARVLPEDKHTWWMDRVSQVSSALSFNSKHASVNLYLLRDTFDTLQVLTRCPPDFGTTYQSTT